jgi:hypothetical protein
MSRPKKDKQPTQAPQPDRVAELTETVARLERELAEREARERAEAEAKQAQAPQPTQATTTPPDPQPDFVAQAIEANANEGKVRVGTIFGYDPNLSPLERELAKLDAIRRRDRLEREDLARYGRDHGNFEWRMRMIQCGRR